MAASDFDDRSIDWKKEILARLPANALEPVLEPDVLEELSQHLEDRYRELRAQGSSARAAYRTVLSEWGSEQTALARIPVEARVPNREELPGRRRLMSDLVQDLRYALRMLRRNPIFTLAAAMSLALGIGGNAAMFSIVHSVLLRGLPYNEPDRLMRVTEWYPKGVIAEFQKRERDMDIASFTTDAEFNLSGQGEAVHLVGSTVSANFFSVLGVRPELGRLFEAGEDQPGRDDVVIISHSLWEQKFNRDPAIVDRPVMIEGRPRRVVGVLGSEVRYPSPNVRLWVPARFDSRAALDYWNRGWMALIGRLRPGSRIDGAQQEFRSLISEVVPLFPYPVPPNWNASARVIPLQEDIVGDVRGKLFILSGAVGLVLLIACVNVASLLLARTSARRREITIRSALGAGKSRIVRQLLTESIVLAVIGSALGLFLAFEGLALVKSFLPATTVGLLRAEIDLRVLAFVTGLAVVTGFAFGLAPALSAARLNLAESLRSRGQQSSGVTGVRVRSWLIGAEVAIAVVLVIGAGLLLKSLWALTRVQLGFVPDQILTLTVFPNKSARESREACVSFYDEVLRRAQRVTGVEAVAAANSLPLSADLPAVPVEIEDHPLDPGAALVPMLWSGAVTPDYFRVMQIPILMGRSFSYSDGEKSEPVIIVSATTAKRFWGNDSPIGKHIRVVWEKDGRTVVGVAGDVRQFSLSDKSPGFIQGAFYMPYAQSVDVDRFIPSSMTLALRTSYDSSRVGSELREVVASLNPNTPVSEVRSMSVAVGAASAESRAITWLFLAFGLTALVLASVGTYGVVSYAAAQRTYEMGVRVALGATRKGILRLVIGQSVRLVVGGLAVGVVISLVLTRVMTGLLYAVTATDPVTFLLVVALFLVIGAVAGYFPARRAASVDPMLALRNE
ncbi:MAG TPA: ABC transporter permease [Blastocatellia bacterium]|nr:ABC transporter permease [Blastocatellia bacterium]